MPKKPPSMGNDVKQQAIDLLNALQEVEVSTGALPERLTCPKVQWEGDTTVLHVRGRKADIQRLIRQKIGKNLSEAQYQATILRLKILNILKAPKQPGITDLHFRLELWSRDQQKNREEFEKRWEDHKNKKSGKSQQNDGGDEIEHPPSIEKSSSNQDWGEAPDVSTFFGREDELATLEQWIVKDKCRLVALLGMGGIGKTALSVKLAENIKDKFDYIIWRSLREAPPIDNILSDLIKILSNQQETNFSDSTGEKIAKLIKYFRASSCLVILDNMEAILQGGNQTGYYQDNYEEYGTLIKRISESSHESCLVITSREKPNEIASLEGDILPVRTLPIKGLNSDDVQKIIQTKGMLASAEEINKITELYNGNPLFIKIMANPIKKMFGNISNFLSKGTTVFGKAEKVLEEQFKRLSKLEQDIMYWLAIYREPVSIENLEQSVFPIALTCNILQSLNILKERELIDTVSERFTLQNVLMEYIITQLINNIKIELIVGEINLFNSHALIMATAKDYVRETQIRLILKPLINQVSNIEQKIISLLPVLQKQVDLSQGYVAGNIINILGYQNNNLTGLDFSNLTIREAYMRRIQVHNVNFSKCQIIKCTFNEIFSSILSISFSSNGKFIATGDANREIRLWQVTDDKLKYIFSYKGHINWVHTVIFSPNSQILASGSTDKTIRLWDVNTGQCLKTLQGHQSQIWSVSFSPNGQILASGSTDKTIRLWDAKNAENTQCVNILQGHQSQIWSVSFSPNGQILASGSTDKTIRLWDVNTGQCLKILQGHSKLVKTISFSSNSPILASGSLDQTIRLWDVNTGQCLKTLRGHSKLVRTVAFSPNGQILASGSDDQTIRLWDVNTGQCLKILDGKGHGVESISFSPDGKSLVSGSYDQTLKFWNVENVNTAQCIKTLQGYTGWIWSVAFSPTTQNGSILASGSDDQTIRLWNIKDNKGQYVKSLHENTGRIWSIFFSPDGKTVVSGNEDQTVRIWNINTEHCRQFKGHTARVRAVTFSPNGKFVVSGSEDQTVRIWDAKTGECLQVFDDHDDWVWTVAFSPDGQILASGSLDQTVKLWNINTGKCFNTLTGHTNWIRSVAFSPDGQILASGSLDQTVKLWNINTGECFNTLTGHHDEVWTVAFSPDGQILASGSLDQTVKLWNINTGKCFNTLTGHTNWIRSVAFSPDGQILASGSEDESVKLWYIPTGNCIDTLKPQKPYEGMNINEIKNLTEAQKITLKALGAIDN